MYVRCQWKVWHRRERTCLLVFVVSFPPNLFCIFNITPHHFQWPPKKNSIISIYFRNYSLTIILYYILLHLKNFPIAIITFFNVDGCSLISTNIRYKRYILFIKVLWLCINDVCYSYSHSQQSVAGLKKSVDFQILASYYDGCQLLTHYAHFKIIISWSFWPFPYCQTPHVSKLSFYNFILDKAVLYPWGDFGVIYDPKTCYGPIYGIVEPLGR